MRKIIRVPAHVHYVSLQAIKNTPNKYIFEVLITSPTSNGRAGRNGICISQIQLFKAKFRFIDQKKTSCKVVMEWQRQRLIPHKILSKIIIQNKTLKN